MTIYNETSESVNKEIGIPARTLFLIYSNDDIAMFEVKLTSEDVVNYSQLPSEISEEDKAIGKEAAIVGYPDDKLEIVKTKIFKWNVEYSQAVFYTEDPSHKGASGAPVMIESKLNGTSNILLLGIYNGKIKKGEDIGRGVITKYTALARILGQLHLMPKRN